MSSEAGSVITGIVRSFITRNLSLLVAVMSLLAGAFALLATPREEEPQIVVPMADIIVQVPGHSALEVEQLVTTRLEKLLYQVDGVEYVYSMSQADRAIVTVRFFVGEDLEDSLVRLHNKVITSSDQIPKAVSGWIVKPAAIDDVPIVSAALYSDQYSGYELRRVAEEIERRLQQVPNTGPIRVIGGQRRQIVVELDPSRLAAHELTPMDLDWALRVSNTERPAGSFARDDRVVQVAASGLLIEAHQLRRLVIGVHDGQPVYLENVAHITDGPEELASYTTFRPGAASDLDPSTSGAVYQSVTIAVAKKPGTNAVFVAQDVHDKLDELVRDFAPAGVEVATTRDSGVTADQKVGELVEGLAIAILIVITLITLTLGWREALIVGIAVPITFGSALLVNYLAGYTINRVTLFALILSLGLVVDDPIANVDNIQRHIRARPGKPLEATISAVREVLPPVILSTLAIVASFAPMFFITGMMGPYMGPMAINVPLAVLFSTVSALTVVPWLAYHLLKRKAQKTGEEAVSEDEPQGDEREGASPRLRRLFSAVVSPLLASRAKRRLLMLMTVLAFFGAASLAATGAVPLKLLPFDNKNELQVVVDMDEGTSLEHTNEVAEELAEYLRGVPEVTDVTTYVGLSSPMDFNGLVRHYYLRQGPNVADVRVNLVGKDHREQQSHAIGLRLRDELTEIAARHGAKIKLVELPPGPPVLATVTAEVYGAEGQDYGELVRAAGHLEEVVASEEGMVDIDSTVEAAQKRFVFEVDQEKAAAHGVAAADIAQLLQLSLAGVSSSVLHEPHEANPLSIRLRLPRIERASLSELEGLYVAGRGGHLIQLSELGRFAEREVDRTIFHKNLRRVAFVYGEAAGRPPAEAILSLQSKLEREPLGSGIEVDWAGEGEWKITLDVFRDLGIAFGIACIGIYILLVYETRRYFLPLVLMIAIPLTVIGIMPGFWLLNLATAHDVGGYANPVFFTATAMIGMIGLSGIVVRNSVVLITFIRDSLRQGMNLKEAIISAGAVRLRPIVLTAATTALSSLPITLDPVFSGLAWALIFGIFVSTAFSLVIVPVAYYALYHKRPVSELAA